MRIRIETESEVDSQRVSEQLKFCLARVNADIADVRITIADVTDPFGIGLFRCSTDILLRHGERVSVEETQPNRELAVNRALERSIRTVQRRLGKVRRQRSA